MDILAIDEAAADAAAKFTLGKKAHAVRLDVPPTLVSGQTRYNATSYGQPVASDGNDLYFAIYSTTGALIIHKRTLPLGSWSTFDLGTISGNPLVLPVDTDSHNTVSIFVDAQGYIHVAANMHGDVMRYVRSTNPRDITAWTAPGVTGSVETQVTYPRFAMHPDGTLFLLYRDGASGMGDLYLNRKNVGGAWTQLGKIADGKTTSENPYETRFVVDRFGRLNIGITWRPNGGDHNTNADVHFIRSDDKGATWKSVNGTAVALPLLHANSSARALATAATNSGIINQFGLDVDTQGRPHMALTLADGTTPDRNVHHLWWNGAAWVNDQVTNLGNGMGYNEIPTRPVMICSDNGRALIAYSSPRWGSTIGTFRMIDVTESVPVDFPIALLDGRDAELSIDERALREKNIYRTIVTAANGEVTAVGPEYNDINNWNTQFAAVLSVDLDLVSELAQRKVRLPALEIIGTVSLPENLSVPSTQTADALISTSAPAFVTARDARGRRLFAQVSMRARIDTAGSGRALVVMVREVKQGGSSRNFGTLTFTGASTSIAQTPWMPISQLATGANADIFVDQLAKITGGAVGTVSASSLRIGALDGPVFY
ncbi:BNR repeat-containing protein [Rhodococcus sp. MEB041]|uniref:BNR repeat-containing protein n=1 Tax=Rhodococcus sp. MEB041 TaxID=3040323 RepID=UPI00254CAFA9|nr:BNR repeat-containing protein [Rhodococcus sp. MEB041]